MSIRHSPPQHAVDLEHHRVLMFTGGRSKPGWTLQRGDESVFVPVRQARFRINNSFAVLRAAQAGLGVARLPRRLAAAAVASGELIAVLDDWRSPSVAVHAVFPSARFLTPKVRAFVAVASENFAR